MTVVIIMIIIYSNDILGIIIIIPNPPANRGNAAGHKKCWGMYRPMPIATKVQGEPLV